MASWRTSSMFDDMKSSPEASNSTPDTTSDGPQRSNSGAAPSERQHIRLACQACQRKKIKCDRFFPCGQCSRSSLQCVASTRKPRARHTGKRAIDSELRNRISKLENLVETLSGDVTGQAGLDSPEDDGSEERTATEPPRKSSIAIEKYMGSQFWSSLSTEVTALREALEDEPGEIDEDEGTPSNSNSSGPSNSADYDLLLCPPGTIYVMPGALNEPNQELSAKLCTGFCDNVDRLFKLFHRPTFEDFMIGGGLYLGHDHSFSGNKALKAAVWFAAVNALSESQCVAYFGQSRPDALNQFKRIADVALSQADLMNTTDIATMQALVTYFAASRLTDPGRRMWTLIAVAVRIAKAMGLHRETVPRTPFMTEIRRRLFHQIRFLDAYSSLDRGSEILIAPGSFDTPFPNNCNDSEFNMNSTSIPNYKSRLTDTSFALMAFTATERTHLLFIPEDRTGATWQQRLEMAEEFDRDIREKYLNLCDMNDPFQRMMELVGQNMVWGMKLRAVRPVQKHTSSTPPRVDSPYVLQLAAKNLKYSERNLSDPDTTQWRWMVWVPWHALAVALAGLCSVRDTDLAQEAWRSVEGSYARNLRFVAEGRHGMLWRPIEKLYRKASAFRDHREHESMSTGITPPSMQQSTPAGATHTYAFTNPNNPTDDEIRQAVDAGILPPAPTGTAPRGQQTQEQQDRRDLQQHMPGQLLHPAPGVMPTTGVPNSDMDLGDLNINMDNDFDFRNGDLSWMDFERILEDMSNPADMSMGGEPWPQDVGVGVGPGGGGDGSWMSSGGGFMQQQQQQQQQGMM